MLYVTTRDNRDAFTAHRVLHGNRGADGGMYLPFKTPLFSPEEMDRLMCMSFNQCAAEILNLLFGAKLSATDLDFAIGRHPVRYQSIGRKTVIAETWHNLDGSFGNLSRGLTKLMRGENANEPGDWTYIAIRIAALFGMTAQLRQAGAEQAMDIAVPSGDFRAVMSAWYAKQWGLPIGNIVCCCNENNTLWDLICHGQMRTDAVSIPTGTPEADVSVPVGLERLVYEAGGVPEVQRYLEACRNGRAYTVGEDMLSKLRRGLYISVIGSQRMMTTIPSVYRTHHYLLSPYGALVYAGLMDYRAKTGETRSCLIFTESSPLRDKETVAAALGIAPEEINRYI